MNILHEGSIPVIMLTELCFMHDFRFLTGQSGQNPDSGGEKMPPRVYTIAKPVPGGLLCIHFPRHHHCARTGAD